MQFMSVTFQQILVMLLLILIGYYLYKSKMLNASGVNQLTGILLDVIFPVLVLSSFMGMTSDEQIKNFLIVGGLAIFSYLITILAANLLVRPKKGKDFCLERFCTIFPNNGFMGIPVISALLGKEAICYATSFICIGNAILWTYGISLMGGIQGSSPKEKVIKILGNRSMVAFFLGIIIAVSQYLLHYSIPTFISDTCAHLGNMNTPLAMFIVGTVLAQNDIGSALKSRAAYRIMFLSNFFIPLLILGIYVFLPIPTELKLNNLISISCPVSSAAVIFSNKFNKDNMYVTQIFILSNVMTLFSMPAILGLAVLAFH